MRISLLVLCLEGILMIERTNKVDEASMDTSSFVESSRQKFEHQKLEQVSGYELGPKNLKSFKLELGKVSSQAWNQRSSTSQCGIIGGTLLLFNVVHVDNIVNKIYMGHLPMKTKFNANIGCVMSLKWLHGK